MKILFLQTGGTIDKDYPPGENHHGYNFLITTPAFLRILDRIKPNFEFETQAILQKDSLEINDADRNLILQTVTDSDYEKIIITHGTDTMLQTAEFLSTLQGKTIVLTGALLPETFKNSDADFNLGTAVGAISTLEPGVYIAMNGKVLLWNKAVFDSDTNRFTEKEAEV